MNETGQRIKQLRRSQNFTQEELGGSIGKTKTAIANYEVGRVIPPAEALMKLADKLETTVDYLLGRSDKATLPLSPNNKIFRDESDVLLFFRTRLEQEGIIKEGDTVAPSDLADMLKLYIFSPDVALRKLKAQGFPRPRR